MRCSEMIRMTKWPLLLTLAGCGAASQGPGAGGAGGSAGSGGSGTAGAMGGAGGSSGAAGAGGTSGRAGGGRAGGTSGGGAGAGGAAGAGGSGVGGVDSLNAPAKCSSGSFWTPADRQTFRMRPGESCAGQAACHGVGTTGLHFDLAGTVYPTGHEPDDCNGFDITAPGAQLIHVVVTDATGTEVSLLPNDVGNFYATSILTLPVHAKITSSNGQERAMVAAIDNADCNSCHTQHGDNAAPGRLTIPF